MPDIPEPLAILGAVYTALVFAVLLVVLWNG